MFNKSLILRREMGARNFKKARLVCLQKKYVCCITLPIAVRQTKCPLTQRKVCM